MEKIYLDFNATTPIAKEVFDEIVSTLKIGWGNPSSCYENGIIAKNIVERSRKQVADMISCEPHEIIFTSGGTESNNLILNSAVKQFAQKGSSFVPDSKEHGKGEQFLTLPHIISSNVEHDSIRLTLQHFSEMGIAEVSYVSSNPESGCINIEKLFEKIQPNTCLITVMLANNETGVIEPISEIGAKVKELNKERISKDLPPIYFHTDAAQGIGKIPVNVGLLGVHYLTIVGHKFYGPRIGALFSCGPVLPMFYGGGQERNLRPGTQNTCMIAGLGKACELVTSNLEKYHNHMMATRDYLEEQLLQAFPGKIHFNGKFPNSQRIPNTCNFSIIGPAFRGDTMLTTVNSFEASVGAACHSDKMNRASPILLNIGIPEEIAINALRLSVGRETSKQEVDGVVSDIKAAVLRLAGDGGNQK